jgi:hypothetical protein
MESTSCSIGSIGALSVVNSPAKTQGANLSATIDFPLKNEVFYAGSNAPQYAIPVRGLDVSGWIVV